MEMTLSKSIALDRDDLTDVAAAERSSADAEFIEKLKAGNAEAFNILIDRYSADIYALLYRLTENAEEAGDLTQETFLRALRAIRKFRGDADIKTWLYRIAINESRNRFRWWKRRKRESTISLDEPLSEDGGSMQDTIPGVTPDPEAAILQREREYVLTKALQEIPEIYREAVVLCDIEGFTYDEIAVALNINLGTVKSRIGRGREELRRRLKDF